MPLRNEGWLPFGVACLVLGASLLYLSHTVADADLWGHIRFGQDILLTRSIATDDPYSYLTKGRYWVNHEWLSEVIFASIYGAWGPRGLITLKAALSLLLVGASYAWLRRHGLSPVRSAIVLVVIVCALRPGLGTLRPQLFTYLGFFAVLLIIQSAEHGRSRWLGAMPILFALWVNLHGGFLAGVAVFWFWGLIRLMRLATSGQRTGSGRQAMMHGLGLVLGLGASGLALLLNPYGTRLVMFLLQTATIPRPDISEWAPVKIMSQFGLTYLVLIGLTCFSIGCGARRRNPVLISILIGVAIAPLIAVRHLPLFALAVVVLAGPLMAEPWERWMPDRQSLRVAPAMTVLALAATALCIVMAIPNFRCIHLEPWNFSFPVRAVALLKQSHVEGNLATIFNWGEYAIWHLGPRVRVSIDGRRETVYSDEVRRKALNFEYGRGEWDAVLREGWTEMALVHAGTAPENLLRLDPGWVLVYEDRLSRLFVRRESRLRETIRNTPASALSEDGEGQCFPRYLHVS